MSSGVSVSSVVWASHTLGCLSKFNFFSVVVLVGFTEPTDKAGLFPPLMTSSHSAQVLPGQIPVGEVQWKPKPCEGPAGGGGGAGPRRFTTHTHTPLVLLALEEIVNNDRPPASPPPQPSPDKAGCTQSRLLLTTTGSQPVQPPARGALFHPPRHSVPQPPP